jgi:hypothetical protein
MKICLNCVPEVCMYKTALLRTKHSLTDPNPNSILTLRCEFGSGGLPTQVHMPSFIFPVLVLAGCFFYAGRIFVRNLKKFIK